jgi:hypothetical protein
MPSNARAGYQPGYQKIIKVKIQWVFLFPKHYVLWLGEIPLHNVPSRYTQKQFCTMGFVSNKKKASPQVLMLLFNSSFGQPIWEAQEDPQKLIWEKNLRCVAY